MGEHRPLIEDEDHIDDDNIGDEGAIEGLNETGRNLSDYETFFNVSNGIMGTGLLAMGFVFRCAGIWALIIVPVIAVAGNYTGKLLITLLYTRDKHGKMIRTRAGYVDIGESFRPYFGRVFVNIVNFIENFAHAILILLMAGGVMNEIVPVITDDVWSVLCAMPLLSIVFLDSIKSLSRIAMATVFTGAALVIIAAAYSLTFSANWGRTFKSAVSLSLKNSSLAIGITVVTYACQPYLPFIEKDMRNREHFNKVMNLSYTLVTILKLCTGFFVYMAYENLTHPLMTLDLPNGPLRTISSLFLLVVALTFFFFPMFTVFTIVDENWPEDKRDRTTLRYLVRTVILVLALIIAVVTPHFGLGIALVGNFTANILVFIVPCACHLKFNYPNLSFKEMLADVIILVAATIFGCIGIAFSVLELVVTSNDEDLNPTEPLEHL